MIRCPEDTGSNIIHAHQEYGFVMIKPDGLELGISADVLSRIATAGLWVADHTTSMLTSEQINTIYGEHIDKPFYSSLHDSLVGKRALSLVVLGDAVTDKLMTIKGSSLDVFGSIRGDYSLAHQLPEPYFTQYLNGTLTSRQLEEAGFENVLRYDRLHCDDNLISAERSIRALFSV